MNELKCPECDSHNVKPAVKGLESLHWCQDCGAPFEQEVDEMIVPIPELCVHEFVQGGVKYAIQDYKVPGSGEHVVYYYDLYFCQKCLLKKYEKLSVEGSTYNLVRMFDSTPMAEGDSP